MIVILDTNFIIECIKNKIDFFSQIYQEYHSEIIMPQEVINEIEKLSIKPGKRSERESAELALTYIKNHQFKIVKIGNKDVDTGIINYLKDKSDVFLATNDRELKTRAKKANPSLNFLRIKSKKKIDLA